MNRELILQEIRRTAHENGGAPLGRDAFQAATGITQTDWYGKLWVRWGDALKEAGFKPNELQGAISDDLVLDRLAAFVRELKRYPVFGELRMKAREDKSFPSHTRIAKMGSKGEVARKLADYCERTGGLEDVASIVLPLACPAPAEPATKARQEAALGYVYLIRAGKYYKIGRSNAVGRRERELAIQLPERAVTAHVITTDDPPGIESYWHRRFAEKRKNGEWFELSAADVGAFKRRKFM